VASKKPLYIYLHLPKCGGTTIKHHLVNAYNKQECQIAIVTWKYDVEERKVVQAKYMNMPQEEKDRIKWLYGMNVWYDIRDCFPNRDVRFVTVMREPFARTVSHYTFNVGRFGSEQPLLEWDYNLHKEMEGEDGRVIKMSGWFSKVGVYPNYITKYLDRLGFTSIDQFYFIGLTERSEEDFFYLYYLMKCKRFFPRMNITPSSVKVTVTEGYKKEFREKNQEDIMWYGNSVYHREQYYKDNPKITGQVRRMKRKSRIKIYLRKLFRLEQIRLIILKFPRLANMLRTIKWRAKR